MNLPFTDLNQIIHPNAEDIPEYIWHLQMACLSSYWCNSSAIMKELQREGHTDDYVNTYLSYVNMQQANH